MRFAPDPKAKASSKPGTVYAVDGGEGWIYYGQVSAQKQEMGFLRYRTEELGLPEPLAAYPLMNRIILYDGSAGRALRSGRWKVLGRFDLHPDFGKSYALVQCPVGTNIVRVFLYQGAPDSPPQLTREWETRIDDPEIQNYEVMAVWDAEHHIPARLKADYGQEEADWSTIGPVWRYRKMKVEASRRFPGAPGHQLPTD